ncbi:hypothetical protein HXX76_015651 [Chlamydomonas incerta]|uniref:Uncharacterized protein n=1 Tax=Chlamydomonas incerta TaxID=51695 RepID=A0A835VPJ2_CHLIN|nr:hypothetical protein HXX76_015651 [Chlamydomonas incerta]|eukprot:KAG2422980.1 hypothetical protein HXX76_015651 [Chlamydomonas incerta]
MQPQLLRLSPELLRNIASFIDPNYVAAYFKLTCKEVAEALRKQYRSIQLRGEPRLLKSSGDRRWGVAVAAQSWPGAAFVAHWGRPEPWRALSRRHRHRLACLTASSYHPPSLDAALAQCGTAIGMDVLVSAITVGDLDVCRRLVETEGCSRWDGGLVGAAAGLSGSLPVCEWLAEVIPDSEAELLCSLLPAAIFAGHERVLEWALERIEGYRDRSDGWVGAAAKAGRTELLQRLAVRYPLDLEAPRSEFDPEVLASVAFGCPLAVLQQYYEPWGTGLLGGMVPKLRLLLEAAASPTPDWAEKCDWLWAQWGVTAAALGAHNSPVDNWGISAIMQRPDFAQRLQLLASRGLGSSLERHAPRVAGALGSTAAVEFCLDQLPALLRQHAAAPVAAAGGGGGLDEDPAAAQQQIHDFMDRIAAVAAKQGHAPVLRLLRGRGFVFTPYHLLLASLDLTSLRYLLLEDPAGLAPGGDAADWSHLFQVAAAKGADITLLRHLTEQLGAAIDLAAVAKGGSEEALSWAVASLEAAGQAPQPLCCRGMHGVLSSGNWAAADWLVRRGLAPPKQALMRHMLFEDRDIRLVDLQWVVGMGGGQDQEQAQVQWTAELHAALAGVQDTREFDCETPSRQRWLTELVEAVAAELAATAGGRKGRGTRDDCARSEGADDCGSLLAGLDLSATSTGTGLLG